MNVEALEQLVRMRERGLVTEEEYQAKRAEILGRLTSGNAPGSLAALVTPPAPVAPSIPVPATPLAALKP